MPQESHTNDYSGAVYGSLAYDINSPLYYPEPEEYSAPPEVPARPRPGAHTASRTQARAHAAPRTRQAIAPFSVMGVLVAAFVFVVSILAQVELVDVTNSAVELQSELSALQEERAKLQIAYESSFNLAEIEEYAINELGMQRSTADQIIYVDTSAPDKAVVVHSPDSDGFVDRVSDFITGLLSYFG